MARLLTVRDIHGCQKRQGRKKGENIGKKLGRGKGKEKENEQGPYEEIGAVPVFHPFSCPPQDAGEGAGPGIKSGQNDYDIEPVVVLPCMFRTYEAGNIVVAQKGIDKSVSMDHGHVYIPGKAHKAGQGNPPVPFESHHVFQGELFCKNHP